MPNSNSKAGHNPERTCVVCRVKSTKSALLGFVLLSSGLVFDLQSKLQCRKQYICADPICYEGLGKWRRKYMKKTGLR